MSPWPVGGQPFHTHGLGRGSKGPEDHYGEYHIHNKLHEIDLTHSMMKMSKEDKKPVCFQSWKIHLIQLMLPKGIWGCSMTAENNAFQRNKGLLTNENLK